MFDRILVPVDLSEKSMAAVDVAYEFATNSGAAVILLHVIETIEHVEFDEMKSFYERLERSARKGLKELSERFLTKKLGIEQVVVYGHRTREIVEFAASSRADLIVLASHKIDAGKLGHDWNSISYAVAVMAPCAVLLVK